MLVAYLIGINALSGVTGKDGVRASYTFGDPNLAGNYLVISLFMMAACKRPRPPCTRRVGYLVVLMAIGFTGSNGAMLTLLIGARVLAVLSRYRGRAATRRCALADPRVDRGRRAGRRRDARRRPRRQSASRPRGSVPLLRDSFGRSGSSTAASARTIVREGNDLFLEGNATGYGPARTKATLQASQAPYVKEAHNDYLATLLERGVIGCDRPAAPARRDRRPLLAGWSNGTLPEAYA